MGEKSVLKTLIVITSLLVLLVTTSQVVAGQSVTQKAVLVTGASSGIGRNIAERLATEGYFVYAGARKAQDIKELSAIENMQGVRLDVTIQSDIDAAVEAVQAGGLGLYGIVNNAGIATGPAYGAYSMSKHALLMQSWMLCFLKARRTTISR
jgi:NADP-dependent 3-hydroxy acid dehydrogenase YdfG